MHRTRPDPGFSRGTYNNNLAGRRPGVDADAYLFLRVGILGSFTTFSAFGYETFELLQRGDTAAGVANAAANLLLGLAAVLLGRFLVSLALG